MSDHDKSEQVLRKLNPGMAFQHEKTERSSVTTRWGVEWDEMMIARDIMQNFYDANRKQIHEITVSVTSLAHVLR